MVDSSLLHAAGVLGLVCDEGAVAKCGQGCSCYRGTNGWLGLEVCDPGKGRVQGEAQRQARGAYAMQAAAGAQKAVG